MSKLDDLVDVAIKDGATVIHVIPYPKGTYVRIGNGTMMSNHATLSGRDGSSLIAEIKQVCDMPVRRDIDLSGEGVVYTAGKRAILRATTSPYRGDAEKAIVRIKTG